MLQPEQIVEGLNPSQREAVETIEGPVMILAGPGSGKTRVITHRAAYIVAQGVPASQILTLTFTNKAAQEMRHRVQSITGTGQAWMGTFHGFCARLLRLYAPLVGLDENYSIYDRDDSTQALRQTIRESDIDTTHLPPPLIAAEIGNAKNQLLTPEQYGQRPGNSAIADVYAKYQQRLLTNNAVDFDDLLVHVATMLAENPELRRDLDQKYRYVMVDEYQDTNLAQFAIVRALSIDAPNLAVTGDPDQSIYSWRGANPQNAAEFDRHFPKARLIRLEHNYRSTKAILRSADHLIAHNTQRKEKHLHTDNDEGRPVRLIRYGSAREEADNIAARIANATFGDKEPRDHAILYRTNAMSRNLERSLQSLGIPYQIIRGVEFFQRREVKDIVAYLHLVNNPRNDEAFRRVVNVPTRSIGAVTVKRLAEYAYQQQISLMEAARQAGVIPNIKGRSAVAVAKFVALMDKLSVHSTGHLESLIRLVMIETGYREWLTENADESTEERLENLDELLSAATELDQEPEEDAPLDRFLERVALVSDTDDFDVRQNAVSLMTLHSAKGLEFPNVYIVAIEEGQLPHQRSRDSLQDLEEERRLLFVGMTRAKSELQLSLAAERFARGSSTICVPSQFLMELPRDEMEVVGLSSGYSGLSGFAESSDWEEPAFDINDVSDPSSQPDQSGVGEGSFATHDDEGQLDTEVQTEPMGPIKTRSMGTGPVETESMGRKAASFHLTTAAQLGNQDASTAEPVEYRVGMLVMHEEYGIGEIEQLEGTGRNRTARVRFAEDRRSFRLAFSRLQPLN